MAYLQGVYPIVKKEILARHIIDLTVSAPEMAAMAQPGQFAHLKAEGLFLRRPISICEIDRDQGTLRFVFEIKGEGTRILGEKRVGDNLDVMGPLGHGFAQPEGEIIVVGGGIGVPPMLETAKAYGQKATAIVGFRSANAVILTEDFQRQGNQVVLCTDDGTMGFHGFVTQALEQQLQAKKPALICACGPHPMLKGVAGLAQQYGVDCQVSLEERMGCGVGACLVCACRTVKDGQEYLSHVCKDGPVFDSKDVLF